MEVVHGVGEVNGELAVLGDGGDLGLNVLLGSEVDVFEGNDLGTLAVLTGQQISELVVFDHSFFCLSVFFGLTLLRGRFILLWLAV